MKRALVWSVVFAGVCGLRAAHGAEVEWLVSPGITDAEVLTEGDQLFAYYFNPDTTRPPVVEVNTVPFFLHSTSSAPPGLNFNGSYNNPEGLDLYQVAPNGTNAGLEQILDSQNWGSASPLTITGLTPGQPYVLQYMISDDRANFRGRRNYDVSDNNDPEGARDIELAYHSTAGGGLLGSGVEAKIFTGFFIADNTGTQNIYNILYEGTNHTGGNSGSQVNAIQLRLIPEPASLGLITMAGLGLLSMRRRDRRD